MLGTMKSGLILGLAIAISFIFSNRIAEASSTQPAGINLGGSSFSDGFGGLSPGWVYQQYLQYESYGSINDAEGRAIGQPIFNHETIRSIVSLNQIIYATPYHFLNGTIQAVALVPLVCLYSHNKDPALVSLKSNGFGVGDLTFGPVLQMPPIIRSGRPVFVQRFEFDVLAPTGGYNIHKDINQSAGFWSINPYWAMTILPTPRLEFSARLYYLYNFRRTAPASTEFRPSNTQAGQAIWANFAASYAVTPQLDIGVNGYAFQQITPDKTNGVTQAHSETENISIGPGLAYTLNKSNIFFANAYLPVVEKNNANGLHLVFRWIHAF